MRGLSFPTVFAAILMLGSTTSFADELEAAAASGDPEAQIEMGDNATFDLDYAAAAVWFEKAAAQGSAAGLWRLGQLHQYGQGTAKSEVEARKLYARAAELGDRDGQYLMAIMHDLGLGGGEDDKVALEMYRAAAAQGQSDAIHKLSFTIDGCLTSAKQIKRDESFPEMGKAPTLCSFKNLSHYTQSIQVDQIFEIASVFGIPVLKDSDEAEKERNWKDWYKLAAQKGSLDALYLLGVREEDDKTAISMVMAAANQGNADAQYMIAQWYSWGGESGRGLPKNEALSKQILADLVARGYPQAVSEEKHRKFIEKGWSDSVNGGSSESVSDEDVRKMAAIVLGGIALFSALPTQENSPTQDDFIKREQERQACSQRQINDLRAYELMTGQNLGWGPYAFSGC